MFRRHEMSYRGYQTITRKQCNVLYGAVKRGELNPPRDCRGKEKKPSFVYRFQDAAPYEGMFLKDEEVLYNVQWQAINSCVDRFLSGNVEGAQMLLDAEDADFIAARLPKCFDARKFWKGC